MRRFASRAEVYDHLQAELGLVAASFDLLEVPHGWELLIGDRSPGEFVLAVHDAIRGTNVRMWRPRFS